MYLCICDLHVIKLQANNPPWKQAVGLIVLPYTWLNRVCLYWLLTDRFPGEKIIQLPVFFDWLQRLNLQKKFYAEIKNHKKKRGSAEGQSLDTRSAGVWQTINLSPELPVELTSSSLKRSLTSCQTQPETLAPGQCSGSKEKALAVNLCVAAGPAPPSPHNPIPFVFLLGGEMVSYQRCRVFDTQLSTHVCTLIQRSVSTYYMLCQLSNGQVKKKTLFFNKKKGQEANKMTSSPLH